MSEWIPLGNVEVRSVRLSRHSKFRIHQPIKYSFLLVVAGLVISSFNVHAQHKLRSVNNTAFKCGEQLVYRIHYGFIDAGEATLKIQDQTASVAGKKTYHVVGTGVSTGVLNLVFKVDDRYETYIDTQSMSPVMFVRRVNEGGFKINQDQLYDQQYHLLNSNGKKYKIPSYTQDMLSSFYFARMFDYSDEKPGKIDSVTTFVDDRVWTLRIKFVRRDTISSDVGKIPCLLFEPMVQKGRIFKHDDDLQVWISDDKNHIPIRAQANILVGSLKLDIESWSGLLNEPAKKK